MTDSIAFFHNMFFIQAVGFIAFAFGVAAFLQKDDTRLKKLMALQSFTLALHFALLGSNGAVVATTVSGVRNIMAIYKNLKPVAPVFLLLYLGLGIYGYEKWTDILPIAAVLTTTIGYFYLEKIPMRLCALFATSCWIIHNTVLGSYGPLLMEIFMFGANARTIYGLYKNRAPAK